MTDNILRTTRSHIKNEGDIAADHRAQFHIDQINDIKSRMNAAKLAALREAEKPFIDELKKAEEEYALFLVLSS
jgi:uncharacterized phage-associated protein